MRRSFAELSFSHPPLEVHTLCSTLLCVSSSPRSPPNLVPSLLNPGALRRRCVWGTGISSPTSSTSSRRLERWLKPQRQRHRRRRQQRRHHRDRCKTAAQRRVAEPGEVHRTAQTGLPEGVEATVVCRLRRRQERGVLPWPLSACSGSAGSVSGVSPRVRPLRSRFRSQTWKVGCETSRAEQDGAGA